jgi:AcrR family transcriptional regulator
MPDRPPPRAPLPPDGDGPGRREAVGRILGAARRLIGRAGLDGASIGDIAREAGVTAGVLRAHFDDRDHLLIETQRAFFRQLHERFIERAQRGEGGLPSALDALDAMWGSVRELHAGAPFIVQTLAVSGQEGPLGERVSSFYDECTALLEDAIHRVFHDDLSRLSVPPERMSVLIRVLLEGLVVELSRARTPEQLARVDAAYADMRSLFERFVLAGQGDRPVDPALLGPVPLPW